MDQEYTVKDIETNTMRLSIKGTYEHVNALAAVWIEHKGMSPPRCDQGLLADKFN